MLVTDPIHCHKGFVSPYKLFYANYMRCIGSILHQKSFVTHWSSSLLIVWLYCPNSLLQQPLSSKFELFSANCMPVLAEFFVKKPLLPEFELIFVNYMPFTGHTLYRKGFVIQYVPFFANYQPTSWQNSPSKKL